MSLEKLLPCSHTPCLTTTKPPKDFASMSTASTLPSKMIQLSTTTTLMKRSGFPQFHPTTLQLIAVSLFQVALFTDYIERDRQYWTNQNHIMILMGQDFAYQDANMWYKNIDKLMKGMNANTTNSKINLLYSTPSCYLKALNDAGQTWSTKTDDFMPLSSSK